MIGINAAEARIAELERELAEMTIALSQAWDQLVPLLQATPQQAASTQDSAPILEAIMAAIDVRMAGVFLVKGKEWFSIPQNIPLPPALNDLLNTPGQPAKPFLMPQLLKWDGVETQWLFMPILIEQQIVGAIGVGVESGGHIFTAVDARILERMTERVANQIIAAALAESRLREAQAARELQIANHIQRSIQPVSGPLVPGLQVAAHWQPARTVGGDAWGWVWQPCGKLACFLLDISGKGLPAALAAVSLHTAIKLALRLDFSPVDVLRIVNDEFYDPYTETELLATVNIITFDPASREIQQANAGHPPTLIRQSGNWVEYRATAPPVGVLPNMEPELQCVVLAPDDIVICYSDGLTEIPTGSGLWGMEGILNVASGSINDAAQIARSIVTAAQQVRGNREAHDDQTLVVINFDANK